MNKLPSFSIRNIDATNTIASRYKRSGDQPDPAPEPNYHDDIIERINAEQNISLSDGPTAVIDVQPDYRYTLATIIYHVIRIYATLDQRNNPLITPSSLTAYCLSIIYGFSLINDSENIRLTKSDFADEFSDNSTRRDFLIELERAYVPAFMKNILTGLMPCSDPRRPKIMFINTLAGYNLVHDYGRSFPITMFLRAHHIVATQPSNQHPRTIFNEWIDTDIMSTPLNLKIGQLIGAGLNAGTYDNWILSRIRTLFNPVTSRTNVNRPTFAPIPTFSPSFTGDVNPYIYLLGADQDNIHNIITFTRSMSAIINEQLTGSTQLGSLFDTPSGVQIMTHFYHGPALPTWHYKQVKANDKEISSTTFATSLEFLHSQPKSPKTNVSLKYPDDDKVIDKPYYLVRKRNGDQDTDTNDLPITFNCDNHVFPDVRYFDPYDYNPSKLPFTIMSGISIETEEIDGFSVPQPNSHNSLFTENSYFLNSAVPLAYITKATTIGGTAPTILHLRDSASTTSPSIGVNVNGLSENRLPYFNTEMKDAAPHLGLYGFKPVTNIERFTRGFTFFGFKLRSQDTLQDPNIPENMLYAWSSLRYVNTNCKRSTLRTNRVCMLLNLRTIYGTNVTLSQSVHPSRLIPVS